MINILKQARRVFCGAVRSVGRFIYRLWMYLATWQAHRDTIKHLNRMSNAQLRDIGITRGEINNMVWMKNDILDAGDRTND
jgi:uncharacterized protein YjiS (DUF1127 family)